MPDLAEERRLAKADGRYFTIEAQQVSYDGTTAVHGELDLADAHDLETAVAGLAAQLKDLGSEESLDVRRALAVGELARCQPTFDLNHTSVEPVETNRGTQRQVVLYVHLTDAALPGTAGTARLERGNSQVTAGQVRDWCHTAGSVVVKPVIDLDAHDPVESPVVPDRHAEIVALRDRTCVFPWCTRPARRCDKDHSVPHSRGGPTCPCNLAPLCRRHHRIKTHGALDLPHRSSPAPTCGPPSTATSTSATPPAPSTSVLRPAPATRLSYPAPHPAHGRGQPMPHPKRRGAGPTGRGRPTTRKNETTRPALANRGGPGDDGPHTTGRRHGATANDLAGRRPVHRRSACVVGWVVGALIDKIV